MAWVCWPAASPEIKLEAKAAAQIANHAPIPANGHKPTPKPNKRKQEALSKVEAQIHSVEGSLKELEMLIERSSAAQKVTEVQMLGAEYASQQAALDDLLLQWAALAEN